MCGCAVSAIMYLDHLKFCLVCINGRRMSVVVNVMLSLMSVMIPPPVLHDILLHTVMKLCTVGVLALGVSLVF